MTSSNPINDTSSLFFMVTNALNKFQYNLSSLGELRLELKIDYLRPEADFAIMCTIVSK